MKEFQMTMEEDAALEFGFGGEIVPVYVDADPYTGAYEVTPKPTAQSLKTAQKLMTDDLTIQAIPYYEVSNLQKGKTVIIGG